MKKIFLLLKVIAITTITLSGCVNPEQESVKQESVKQESVKLETVAITIGNNDYVYQKFLAYYFGPTELDEYGDPKSPDDDKYIPAYDLVSITFSRNVEFGKSYTIYARVLNSHYTPSITGNQVITVTFDDTHKNLLWKFGSWVTEGNGIFWQ